MKPIQITLKTMPSYDHRAYCRNYYASHRAEAKAYYERNKDKFKRRRKEYETANKEKLTAHRKLSYKKNIGALTRSKKKYNDSHKEQNSAYKLAYRELHKEEIRIKRQADRERVNLRRQVRLKQDKNYYLACLLRARLNRAIRGQYKAGSAVDDLGCTIPELKFYLEGKFSDGMTWDNHGRITKETTNVWHIDHIIPLAFYDLTDREQLLKACHYRNLQPLWAKDNLKKSWKIVAKI